MLFHRTTCGVLLSFPGKQCLGGWALSATKMDGFIFAGFCTQLLVLLPGSGFCVEWTDPETSRGIRHQKRENQSFFHQMLFKGRRCANAFGFPSGSLQLEHTAHCAGSVPLSPLLLEGLCSKTPEYLQCCHSACVSHLQQIWPSFSEFPYPLKVSSFAFTEQRSPSSSLKPLCWGPTIFC